MNQRLLEAMGWRDLEDYQYWHENSETEGWIDCLRGVPPGVDHHGMPRAYMRVAPDYSNDDAACLDALDALSATSTCIAVRLDNNKWMDGKRVWVCEIINCDIQAIREHGATRREAMVAALCKWYGVEVAT